MCNITESGWFWKRLPRNKVSDNFFLKSVWKKWLSRYLLQNSGQLFPIKWLSINLPICGWIKLVIINMTYTCMESYSLSCYCKQPIKISTSCLRKLDGCCFLKYGFRSGCSEKLSTSTSNGWKVTTQGLVIGFCKVTCNHKVKYWPSADLLFLIKNIMQDGFY